MFCCLTLNLWFFILIVLGAGRLFSKSASLSPIIGRVSHIWINVGYEFSIQPITHLLWRLNTSMAMNFISISVCFLAGILSNSWWVGYKQNPLYHQRARNFCLEFFVLLFIVSEASSFRCKDNSHTRISADYPHCRIILGLILHPFFIETIGVSI